MSKLFNIIKYQDDFCDNFSNYAYGKIIQNKSGIKCYYENIPKFRNDFEKKMKYFNLELEYLCSNRVENFVQKAFKQNEKYLNFKDIKRTSKRKKSGIINTNKFKIEDINLLNNDIKKHLNFIKQDFIISYDILEDINLTQSIGLYINPDDITAGFVDWEFIHNATKRLNKYIKKPKLFIFTKQTAKEFLKSDIDYKIIDFLDWREEFFFLKECKHKIILGSNKSYSRNLWAAILNENLYSINIYSKNEYKKNLNRNWLSI